jgi:hypothetical protein
MVRVQAGRAGEQSSDPRVELVMRAVIQVAKAEGRPLSGRALTELVKVKAGAGVKRAALDLAVARGHLATKRGPRNAVLHSFVSDMVETVRTQNG